MDLQLILLLFLLLFGVASPLYAMDIKLQWAPNDEPNVAGYKVFYREAGQAYNYDVPYWECTEPVCTVYDLDETKTYYFVVRAFDTKGQTSDDSNEVVLRPSTSTNTNDNGAGSSGAGSSGAGSSGAGKSDVGSSDAGNSGAGSSGAINNDAGGSVANAVESSGGGGGCFIATAAYGSQLEPHIRLLGQFRDRFLLRNGPGKIFVKYYYKYSPPAAHFISKHAVLKALVCVFLLPLVGFSWIFLNVGPGSALLLMLLMGIGGVYVVRWKKHGVSKI